MKNRMVPLGYSVEGGVIVIAEKEMQTVKMIFDGYCNGQSLKQLVQSLHEANTIFKENVSQWNKGRIYHILEDERYIGAKGYPPIVDMEVFHKANNVRKSKGVDKKITPTEAAFLKGKVFCGKCGSRLVHISDNLKQERWSCPGKCKYGWRPTDGQLSDIINRIVNKVAEDRDLPIPAAADAGYRQTSEIMRLTNELSRIIEQTMPSFHTGKKLIFQIASKKFSACREDKRIYTDYVLEQVKRVKEAGRLDKEFLQNAVHKIKIISKKVIVVEFINGVTVLNREEA